MRQLLHEFDWEAARHHPLATISARASGAYGTLDHLMPKDGMSIYERLVPGIPIRRILDAGHIITEETPEEVNLVLRSLLGGQATALAILQLND